MLPNHFLSATRRGLTSARGGFRAAALYERVLLMETVDVDEVLATVRRAPAPLAPGVAVAKVPRAKLLAYLEREGVAVTHTSGRRARATRTRF